MKRKALIIGLFILILSIGTQVQASSFTTSMTENKQTIAPGEEIEIQINISDLGETGINALGFTIEYDKTKFEEIKAENMAVQNGWSVPTYNEATGKLITDNGAFIKESGVVLKIRFKAKQAIEEGTTKIEIKEISASDGEADISSANIEKVIMIKKVTEENSKPSTTNNTITTENIPTADTATTNIPKAGKRHIFIGAGIIIIGIGIVSYMKFKKFENV